MYVDTAEGLQSLVAQLTGAPVVAVDTEFMRERTYYARLCLVQVATDTVTAIVDPLSVPDLGPLLEVLRAPGAVKVVHAGSQDLEILYRLMGSVPAPVFDTQVAATLIGLPAQIGYQQLVRSVAGVDLGKAHTYTNWAARPLTKEQVAYALDDVRYLPGVYSVMRDRLHAEGRLAWLAPDFERLTDPATYDVVPEEQFRRVKRASALDRTSLAVLRELAAWRECEAQRRDIPKRWLVADEALLEIARRTPATPEELAAVRGIGDQVVRRYAKDVLAAVGAGLAVPEEERPRLAKRRRIQGDVSEVADLLSALVRLRARENNVAPSLIASRDDLERFAAGERGEHPLASGWRHTLVGAELEELLEGKLALAADQGRVVATPREGVDGGRD